MQIIVGVIFTSLTLFSIASASLTSREASAEVTTTAGASIIAEKVDDDAKAVDEEAAIFPVTIPTIIFQVVMILTSLYFGMLFLNWGDTGLQDPTVKGTFSSALYSTWAKIIAQWLTIALFTVSIMLTVCCKDRIL